MNGERRRSSVILLALGVYVWLFAQLIHNRLTATREIWQTDFAIFRQSGNLLWRGKLGQVYQYVPPDAVSTQYGQGWTRYLGHVDGYYYAQSPWHTIGMIPFSWLPIQQGYALYTSLMLAAVVGAAYVLYRDTQTYRWPAILLSMLFLAPFVATEAWGKPDYTFNLAYVTGPLRFESVLGVTLWYGQYTPVILFLLVCAFSHAQRGNNTLAGLLLVLATMKPNVLFGIPLVLLVADDKITIIRKTAAWAVAFALVFTVIPGLGFPVKFSNLVMSYTTVFWPIFLQAHNYVWMYGILVTTVALVSGGNTRPNE